MAKRKAAPTLSKTEKSLLSSVGQKIRSIREGKKLTVYDVTGSDLPVKFRQHWQAIENGKKNISLTTLFKIAKTLGVPAESIVAGIRV